jgi:hypothetical protein
MSGLPIPSLAVGESVTTEGQTVDTLFYSKVMLAALSNMVGINNMNLYSFGPTRPSLSFNCDSSVTHMRFEVLTAIRMSMVVFWVVTPC